MHAIDGHELLGERVRHAEERLGRPRDPVEELVAGLAAEPLVEALAEEPVPVGAHAGDRGRMGDDRGRPVDRVDLRHQRRVHEPCLVVEVLVAQLRVLRVQAVADRVVLEHEQRVQDREPDPEVAGDPGEVDVRLDLLRDQAARVELELPVLAGADGLSKRRVAAVDLRPVPPVRVRGGERRRPVRVGAGVPAGPLDLHRMRRPRVVVGEWDRPRVLRLVRAVAEPVVHLELDPRAGEQVQRRRRDELVPRHQLAAHRPWVRLEELVGRVRVGLGQRHVATEAAAEAPHQRLLEVVEGAVERSRGQVPRLVAAGGRPVVRAPAAVVEVLCAQAVSDPDQGEHRDRLRHLVPAEAVVESLGRRGVET